MLNQTDHSYLNEMGITALELVHPERLLGYQSKSFDLPTTCQLLLVSPVRPSGEDAQLFSKVLGSMKMTIDQALHVVPSQLVDIQKHQLNWVWFAGCDTPDDIDAALPSVKLLSSPALADIHGNTQNRRDLWLQICSYA